MRIVCIDRVVSNKARTKFLVLPPYEDGEQVILMKDLYSKDRKVLGYTTLSVETAALTSELAEKLGVRKLTDAEREEFGLAMGVIPKELGVMAAVSLVRILTIGEVYDTGKISVA